MLLISVSCIPVKNNNENENKQNNQITVMGDEVIVPENSTLFSKISLQTTDKKEYKTQSTTTGTVKTLSGCLAEISSPFEGRMTKSFVQLGQKVSAGTPIFEINSPQYSELIQMFVQAKQEKQLATNNYQRQKDLLDHQVGSKKEFEEAESALQIAQNEYEKVIESLKSFNVKPDDASLIKPLIVRSPINGEIVKYNITVGQYLKIDAEPVVTVADLNKVWVVAHVKEKNIGTINQKDEVQVSTEACPDKPISGFVSYIGNMMDEQTRSVEVYVECRNHDKMLKPGMFVTVSFTQKLNDALIVPTTAVLQEDDHSFVFVQTGKGKFVKKQVTVTSAGDKDLIVRSGIAPGDVIVAEGGFYLR
jgi:cobalt-zinc-cadmium efflux system membrane fusion protein